ncbi:MAG: cobalt ECF transporter T component CbiQ [Elainella sp. Prado103]|jgi:cobalt/nickel transport system permease protein|nr:cobalt ECF transporter T component CbiQ [Elainella sp. Prado103]
MKLALDEYAHLKSWIHQWEAQHKLVGLIALIFAFALVEHWQLIPFMLLTTSLLYLTSRLPFSFWSERIRYPGLFLLGVVILLPFLSGTTVLWNWGILTVRQEGMVALFLIASRFLSIITVGLILFGTTPFLTTVRAMRSLGLPIVLADMLLLTYRYLFEVANSLTHMQRSMRLRGFQYQPRRRLSHLPDRQTLDRLASLAGTLLVRSYEQSERIYKAMRLRGYGYQKINTFVNTEVQPKGIRLWSMAGLVCVLLVALSFVVAEVLI